MVARRATERLLNAATVIATLCAITVAAVRLRQTYASPKSEPRVGRIAEWRSYGSGGLRDGPSDAPVRIVEFADFQCPYCRRAAGYLDSVLIAHPNDVVLLYRHYPIHRFAHEAAVAAECSAQQGRFPAVRHVFFAQADSIGVKPWTTFAREAGVPRIDVFQECMNASATNDAVTRDSLAATRLGVSGTPTFLINDVEIEGYDGAELMDRVITRALAKRPR